MAGISEMKFKPSSLTGVIYLFFRCYCQWAHCTRWA